jgi:hypothetical protein
MWERLICCVLRRGKHDYRLRRQPDALFLECARCGHRSRGWQWTLASRARASAQMRLLLAEPAAARHTVLAADRVGADSWIPHLVPPGELRLTLADDVRPGLLRPHDASFETGVFPPLPNMLASPDESKSNSVLRAV